MKIRIHPTFVAFLAFCTAIGGLFRYLVAFSCVILHEFSHYLIARIAGEEDLAITLMPYGASLSIAGNSGRTAAILIAGPLSNVIAAAFALSLSWLFPELYGIMKHFVQANVSIALVNLLPAYPLDGGRLAREIFPGRGGRAFTSAMTLLLSLFCLILFFIGKCGNLTLLTFALFSAGYFFSFAYRRPVIRKMEDPLYSLVSTDREGNLRKVKIKDGKKTVEKLSEEAVARLVLSYPSNGSIGEVLQQEKERARE